MAAHSLSRAIALETLALMRTHGSQYKAAKAAGISRGTFQHRLLEAQRAQASGELAPFTYEALPNAMPSANELVARRKTQYRHKAKAAEARKLIPVQVHLHGPFGIAHFGDPHIDDDGTNIALLENHVRVVKKTVGLFAANVGDYTNNWIGRLARLWGEQSTSAQEAKILAKWLLDAMPWLYLVGGNHEAWSGANDPIAWIAEQAQTIYEPFAARLALHCPNGRIIRVNARHDFKGHSEWNSAHGPAKAARMGWRDHLLTCGHRHISGYNVLKDPASGLISHAIRVASYKLLDQFALDRNMPDQNIFVCPVTIIDPSKADNDPRCIQLLLDPENGADYLTFLRKRKTA